MWPDVYACVQIVRELRCDRHANASYESAHQLFQAGAATLDSYEGGNLADVWNYSPLEETCVLFARKFLPDTNEEVQSFFTDCTQVGLGSECLAVASQDAVNGANVAAPQSGPEEVNADHHSQSDHEGGAKKMIFH